MYRWWWGFVAIAIIRVPFDEFCRTDYNWVSKPNKKVCAVAMIECEACGARIVPTQQTTRCPECDRMRCDLCDTGAGTVCADCEGK